MMIEDMTKLRTQASANVLAVRNYLQNRHPISSNLIQDDFRNIVQLIYQQKNPEILGSFNRVFALIDQTF